MTLRKNQPKMSEKSWTFFTTGMGREILPASQLARVHSSIASSSMHADSADAASAGAASAICTRGANCAGLESTGRKDTAEVPRDRVYPEAEPKSSESIVVQRGILFTRVYRWRGRNRSCSLLRQQGHPDLTRN